MAHDARRALDAIRKSKDVRKPTRGMGSALLCRCTGEASRRKSRVKKLTKQSGLVVPAERGTEGSSYKNQSMVRKSAKRNQGWKSNEKGSDRKDLTLFDRVGSGGTSRQEGTVRKEDRNLEAAAFEEHAGVETRAARDVSSDTSSSEEMFQRRPSRGPSSPVFVRQRRKWEAETDWLLMGLENEAIEDHIFDDLVNKLGLDRRCRPLVSYLYRMGFRVPDFSKLMDARVEVLSLTVATAKSRILYLSSLGIQQKDLVRIVAKHPRVLEYRTERTMKPRVDFLIEIGVEKKDLAKVITRAPVLLELSVSKTLRPRAHYLVTEIGIAENAIGRLITKHPAVLTYNSETMVAPRVQFFLGLGVSKEGLAKMVARHPQLLHYSIDSMKPRLQYLQAIGMSEEEIATTVSRLGTLFSLSVESSLRPKFDYLVSELGGDVQTVAKYPAYFSLSLDKRIRPRHQFLLACKSLNVDKMPMKYLTLTDEDFVAAANSTLTEYEIFKNEMLLQDFAVKFSTRSVIDRQKNNS